ncbi:hypothetical protein [Petroclostridium sp. X23]|uniref:hypothetical protein n=1 Tax=Petroclostridium sp. X23 TaxID=3045146 RepID=UPI0024AE0992|nr:hypothetical protein [Petroclostridium sp. X23]WHH59110.1 hypothetical protein QKW49_25545 [Petroclostridium sp. X23]
MRQCPYCGEQIDNAASKCVFCGSTVEPQSNGQINEATYEVAGYIPPEQHREHLSNGFKVFITMVATIPLIGQLAGIIMGIIYMNSEGNPDKKSFGRALLTGTLIITVLTCLCCVAYFVFSLYIVSDTMPQIFEQFKNMQ